MEGVGKLSKYYMQMTVLVAETRDHLQHIVNEFERMCDSMVLKINVWKSEVLMIDGDWEGNARNGQV